MNIPLRHNSSGGSAPIQSRHPVTAHGPLLLLLRSLWLSMAAASLLVWIVETPLLYHSALQLHNTNGMFTLPRIEWTTGLHQLGLSPTVYSLASIVGLFLMTASMFAVGVVIFLRRSAEWIALLVSYTFVNLGVGIINAYAGGPALVQAHPNLAQSMNAYMALTGPSFYALFVIPLVFPDGRFVPRWTRWLIPIVILGFLPLPVPVWIPGILQVIIFPTTLLAPVYRYFRVSDPAQREQTRWVMFGLLVALGAFLSLGAIRALFPGLTATPGRTVLLALLGGSLVYLALSFLPISFGIAILRYRLWDIDVLINRTLVYGSLTLTLAALYVGGVILLQSIFRTVTGQSSDLAVAIATLVIAALFNPWRLRLQHFIDHRFYRRKYDATRTLAAFSARLRDEVDMDELKTNLLAVASDTMQPSSVSLWLREGKVTGS